MQRAPYFGMGPSLSEGLIFVHIDENRRKILTHYGLNGFLRYESLMTLRNDMKQLCSDICPTICEIKQR